MGNKKICGTICLFRCKKSFCLFYGHEIPLGREFVVAYFPEVATLSDKGISEKGSFCIC